MKEGLKASIKKTIVFLGLDGFWLETRAKTYKNPNKSFMLFIF